MSFPLKLERFGDAETTGGTVFLPKDRLALIKREAKRAGQELGYRKAQQELEVVKSETSHKLAGKLQDISFTHVEARNAVLKSLETLAHQMINVILPGIVNDVLVDVFTSQIVSLASRITDGPIQVVCSPENVDLLENALQYLPELTFNTVVTADVKCAPHDFRFSAPEIESHVEIGRALSEIRQSVADFYQNQSKDQNDG